MNAKAVNEPRFYSCLKLPHVNKRYDSVNFDLSSQKTFGKSLEISAP